MGVCSAAWETREERGLFGALTGYSTEDNGAWGRTGSRGNNPEIVLEGVEQLELGIRGPQK